MSSLKVEALDVGYGRMGVLSGVNFHIHPGEMVALLGRNGAGKTTLLRTVAGLQRARGGSIELDGTAVTGWKAWRVARHGVAMVLEGARVFAEQTVQENIAAGMRMAADQAASRRRVDSLCEQFPALRARAAAHAAALSGGERMQLAIVQALAAMPHFLLLDEPSVGLSPAAVRQVFDQLDQIRREGEADQRVGLLVAEQMVAPVLRVADRALVLDQGGIAARGTAAEIRDTPALVEAYLGTAGS